MTRENVIASLRVALKRNDGNKMNITSDYPSMFDGEIERYVYMLLNHEEPGAEFICDSYIITDIDNILSDNYISVDDAIMIAMSNTATETRMANLLDLLGIPYSDYYKKEQPTYVVSNKKNLYGAGNLIASWGVINDKLKRKGWTEAKLLPSSIHEWIITKSKDGLNDNLNSIVNDVNDEVVSSDMQLGNRAYTVKIN